MSPAGSSAGPTGGAPERDESVRSGGAAEPLAAVVVPNWNGAELLADCLESLRSLRGVPGSVEVVVVDNASTDTSLEILARFPEVTVLRQSENLGFAAGSNVGIRATGAPFVALLNNDATVEPNWLAALLAALDAHPEAGAATSKVVAAGRPTVLDNVGHVVYADGLTRGRGRLEEDVGQYQEIEEVFGFSGCAALLRRQMLDDVGLFDEDFFAYCEDADLSFRARLRGWSCLYVPGAVAHHRFSATSGSFTARKGYLVERNRFWLAVKNLPFPLLLSSLGATLLRYAWQVQGMVTGRGAAAVYAHTQPRRRLVAALLVAYLDGFRGLRVMLRRRRRIQRGRRASTREVLGWLHRFRIGARQIAHLE